MQTRYIFLLALVGGLLLSSCKKDLPFTSLSFNVTTDSSIHSLGNASLFNFTGNPDNIVFYSGTWGNRYKYANRYSDTSGTDILTFSTVVNTAGTSGTLSLLVSTDYSNDTSKIQDATWTDASTISPIAWATTSMAVTSGAINLTSYKTAGKPIYLAFKYLADANTIQKKWTVSSIALVHKPTGDTSYTILNASASNPAYGVGTAPLTSSPGWIGVNVSRNPTAAQLWTPTVALQATSTLVVAGAATAATAIASEQWIIAGPIDLSRVLRDVPTAIIKGGTTNYTLSVNNFYYQYLYAAKGAYTATFVAGAANINKSDSISKFLTITVK